MAGCPKKRVSLKTVGVFGSLSNRGLFPCLIDAIVIGGLLTIAILLHCSALLWQNRLCCRWHRFCLACAVGGIVSWFHSPVRFSYPSTTPACAAPPERLLSIMTYCYNGIPSRQLLELSSAYCHWLITIGSLLGTFREVAYDYTVRARRRFLCFILLTIILASRSQNSSTVRILAPRNNPT